MNKRGLFFLVLGALLMVIMQLALQRDLPDLASGLIAGAGIGLLILSLVIIRKEQRAQLR